MNRLHLTTVSLIMITLFSGILFPGARGCDRNPDVDTITIAVSRQPISAPVYVGYERKFFEREGLQVKLQPYWTGKQALEAVIRGKADFSTAAETPVLFAFFKDEPVVIIATIADSDRYFKIIARKDRKIETPRDLKGKVIGVTPGTNAQYFLDAYLSFHGISQQEVREISLQPEAMAAGFANGSIDAAVNWEPHIAKLRKKLGQNAVVLENELIYQVNWNMVAGRVYAAAHPETVTKLLRGLIRAQDYIAGNPRESSAITAAYIGDAQFDLGDFNFDVRLGQSLVLDLEEQARWAIRVGLTGKKEVPNFLNLLSFQGMETVAPDSVTVSHP